MAVAPGVRRKKAARKKRAAKAPAVEVSKEPSKEEPVGELEVVHLPTAAAWHAWLGEHHARSAGVWLRFAKKGTNVPSMTYVEALEVALAWGWIDGQSKGEDATFWRQRFTPRRPKSTWSKINRARVEALEAAGKLEAPGRAEVARAKADGRWDAAYDSPKNATVPDDLAAALAANPRAERFFATLTGASRYSVLFRVHQAKRPETRARRIAQFVEMLARHEKIEG